jgi:hypothetical protein
MKTIIKKQVLGYDHAVISEDAENYYVDLKTGFGEGIYPKTEWGLEQAIENQLDLGVE